jgi:uncharacterized protein YjbJ (UPF0337 family)
MDKFDNKKDQFEGLAEEKKGEGKEFVGKLRDDESQEAEGELDQLTGKLKKGFADAKDKVEDFMDDRKKD